MIWRSPRAPLQTVPQACKRSHESVEVPRSVAYNVAARPPHNCVSYLTPIISQITIGICVSKDHSRGGVRGWGRAADIIDYRPGYTSERNVNMHPEPIGAFSPGGDVR